MRLLLFPRQFLSGTSSHQTSLTVNAGTCPIHNDTLFDHDLSKHELSVFLNCGFSTKVTFFLQK